MSNEKTTSKNRRGFRSRTMAAIAAGLMVSVTGTTVPAGADDGAFACDPGFYQVISGQLAELDPATETYRTIGPNHSSYNAMGYRIADGYLYGISGRTLFRVDNSGGRTDVGKLDTPSGSYAGDFDDAGLLNISRGGRDWYKVNVDTLEVSLVAEFSSYTAVADITNVHGVFYGVSSDGHLYSYDQDTLVVREVGAVSGLPETLKAYGAAWSTAGGNLYVGRNSGEIYQVTGYTTGSPRATLVGRAPATSSNDGASCSLAVPIPGLDDVDGPDPESPPRTEAAKEAARNYQENYDEISQTFTPAAEPQPEESEEAPVAESEKTDDSSFTFSDAGMGTGPSCTPGEDVDRPERGPVDNLTTVSEPTELYTAGFDTGSLTSWLIRSGSWSATDNALVQNNYCGYDYTALLRGFAVEDFIWEASFSGVDGINQGGVIFHHASTRSRSGAVVVDLTNEGRTLRWGEYDKLGYYQSIGSTEITAPAAGQDIALTVEVHRRSVAISINGQEVANFEATEVGGMVGLISSLSQVSFNKVSLTALPSVTFPAGAPAEEA